MDCLIEHKHHQDMNRKCSAGVEHHQLVSFFYFFKKYLFLYWQEQVMVGSTKLNWLMKI